MLRYGRELSSRSLTGLQYNILAECWGLASNGVGHTRAGQTQRRFLDMYPMHPFGISLIYEAVVNREMLFESLHEGVGSSRVKCTSEPRM